MDRTFSATFPEDSECERELSLLEEVQIASSLQKMSYGKKQVAVVGAGTSGLMAIKSLKEEGFEPVCFEKSSYCGGLWKYHEEDVEGMPSIMWSTSLNNSKEIGSISDFPPDPRYPNYMRHSDVLRMFTEYGEKFDLFRHIHYNQEVTSVRRAADYNTTGRWEVTTKDAETGNIAERVFDAVMVCVGHLSSPNIPNDRRLKPFRGDIIHTHSVKKFQDFTGKTVCVVGTGSSALDAAVEISHVAAQVYLSVRTPVWICTRHGPYGYPLDWIVYTWDHNILHKIFPMSWSNKFLQEVFMNPRFSHDLFNIHPVRGVANRDFAVNDTISSRLMNGSVILKKDIERCTENGIIFCDDDGEETKVDTIVLGTGYRWEFPFLNSSDFVTEGSKIHLYKCVYPPHLPFPTLGIIGFIVPLGPGFPCVEMQCRWFAHALTGKVSLPRKKDMMRHIDKQYEYNMKRYGDSSRVFVHVDFMPYLEDVASEFSVCPSMLKLLFSDFQLFVACACGPYLPYRFRLFGPHKWGGARKAILEAGQRMRAPLQGKRAFVQTNKSTYFYLLAFLSIISAYLIKNSLMMNTKYVLEIQRLYGVAKYMLENFIKTGKI